ncbi:MAG: hypothetical protein KJ787_03850 [Gammaproteobacteria bacterium]|nr:hypothetical protein [Gammaproteobacteria bacterium]MBU1645447.1 hypothetical protein [Gammaproteobacteria bacterium]MBU1971070.1 hypothetical protein [Gammaproteobacteria bacterium]
MTLAIIAEESYVGFFDHLGTEPSDWSIMGTFTAITVASSKRSSICAHRASWSWADALKAIDVTGATR